MNTLLLLSDLFKKHGKTFDWVARVQDQDELIKRLRKYTELVTYADELADFAGTGIASLVFIETILERVTKKCAELNINIA